MGFIPEILIAVSTLEPIHMEFVLKVFVLIVVQTALVVVYKKS